MFLRLRQQEFCFDFTYQRSFVFWNICFWNDVPCIVCGINSLGPCELIVKASWHFVEKAEFIISLCVCHDAQFFCISAACCRFPHCIRSLSMSQVVKPMADKNNCNPIRHFGHLDIVKCNCFKERIFLFFAQKNHLSILLIFIFIITFVIFCNFIRDKFEIKLFVAKSNQLVLS